MARPLWHGSISFGLVNIPVGLFSAVSQNEQVHFHLLDKKTNSRIHNLRVNERGQTVDWENVVHAYEFKKGKYVVVDQKMLEKTATANYETVEIAEFVQLKDISPIFFEKPYYLLPEEEGFKGYLLLRTILEKNNIAAIAKVVIKTREHLAAIMPLDNYLVLILLRYANELRNINEVANVKSLTKAKIKITPKELALAEQLVKNMSAKWKPTDFHDENKELLLKLIKGNIKKKKTVSSKSASTKSTAKQSDKIEKAKSAEILDFMDLLKKSVAKKNKPKSPNKQRKH